jgi:hypothetical protein
MAAFLLFFAANTFKIVVFNLYILPFYEKKILLYKLAFTPAILLPLILILFLFRKRLAFTIFYILQCAYIALNILYVSFYHNYLHLLQSYHLASEGIDLAANLSIPNAKLILIAVIDLPFFIMAFIYYRKSRNFIRGNKNISVAAAIICIFSAGCLEFQNQRKDLSLFDILSRVQDGETRIVERYGSLVNSLVDLFRTNEKSMIASLSYGEKLSGKGSVHRNNVILIQVESLNSGAIRQSYNGTPIMRYLNSLTGKCVYYPYTISYHFGGGTSDCEFSVINSIEPIPNYPAIKLVDYDYPNSVAARFRSEGYFTAAFHGNRKSYYNRDIAFKKMGFSAFYDYKDLGLNETGWGASDGDLFNAALETMRKQKGNFFYHIITMSSHPPFTNVMETDYNDENLSTIEDDADRDYALSFSYVDNVLKKFVTEAKKIHPDTVFIIYGDHCPNIEKGPFKQTSLALPEHYFEFVPLFIITPDNRRFTDTGTVASFLDIAPTALALSGISYKIRSDGENLLSKKHEGRIPFQGDHLNRKAVREKVDQAFK